MQDSGSDMDWETFETDLSGIDIENNTYRISTDQSIEPLAASIGAVGLLSPPFLFRKSDSEYIIISGFQRVAACLHLGHPSIRVRLVNPDAPLERLAEMAICENSSQRPLNLVETSRSLNLLARYVDDQTKLEQGFQRLGLPDHSSMRDKIMRICGMPIAIQDGILEGVISLNTALQLDDLDAETGLHLTDIFRNLHLSHSKQREILTNLIEVALRDKVPAVTLLHDILFQALLSDPETNLPQKANNVRNYFRSKRFPHLTLTEETFRKESKKLSLGNKVRLQAPAGFESQEYVFTVSIKNLYDLDASINILQNAMDNPALKKILSRN